MVKKTLQKQAYEKDFYAWTLYNAQLLRKRRLSEVDIMNIAEEIESLGKSERRELINRLAVLLAHLLKWKFQPIRQSRSWKLTIKEQRLELTDLLKESPSLKYELEKQIDHAYRKALIITEKETGLEQKKFPKKCPFSLKECLKDNYFPK